MTLDESDYRELQLKQAELSVSKQIISELDKTRGQNVYIQDPAADELDIDSLHLTRERAIQSTGLHKLAEKGLIQVLDDDELVRIGIHVHVVNPLLFRKFFIDLFESIPSTGYCARIVYSTKTGKGKINGEPFHLYRNSRNRKVFNYLVQNPNQKISKAKIWQKAGEKGKYKGDSDSVIIFNSIITTLREALNNISKKHLRLKKTVLLDAEVTLTD